MAAGPRAASLVERLRQILSTSWALRHSGAVLISADALTYRLRRALAHTDVPRVVVSGNHAVPWTALGAVDRAFQSYRLNCLNAPAGIPDRDGVIYETAFVGPGMRRRRRVKYFPARLSQVPLLLTRRLVPDVVVVHTSAPIDGRVSLGCEVNVLPAAIAACRAAGGLVVAQVNPRMPYTFGDGEYDLDDFDAYIEVEEELATGRPPQPDGDARAASGDAPARTAGGSERTCVPSRSAVICTCVSPPFGLIICVTA